MSIEPARGPETRMPVSPQMALRVAVLGTFALIMFGIIFFRLWYLQILTGTQAVRQISQQETRALPIPAPRGQIIAANNQTLVGSKPTSAVQVVPSELPPGLEGQVSIYAARQHATAEKEIEAEDRLKAYQSTLHASASGRRVTRRQRAEVRRLEARVRAVPAPRVPRLPAQDVQLRSLFRRLGAVLRMSPRTIDERVVRGVATTRYAPVTIRSGVGQGPRTVLLERQNEFPGVVAQPVATREYPLGEMAAQVVGTVGAVTEEELKEGPYKGIEHGAIVGQSGLEATYDSYLRGKAGEQTVHVNAAGEPVGSEIAVKQPQAGYELKLSLQPGLQYAGEKALREQIAAANGRGKPADGGAFVAIDPLNGEVLAMGSYPTYSPVVFTKPLSNAEAAALFETGKAAPVSGGRPLLNRAMQDGYPTGSTFKPIIAIGAMEAGFLDPYEVFGAGACIVEGGERFCNAEGGFIASVDLVHALEVSSDTYFYTVGKRGYSHGTALQRMAHKLGIGVPSGIDLPGEEVGTVPDARWVEKLDKIEERCTREHHGSSCHIVAEPHMLWTVGQSMQLATGQGSLLTTPLQMAVAYSALTDAYRTGGEATIVTPHLGSEILEENGTLVQSLDSKYKPKAHFHLNPTYVNLIFEGLHDATTGPGGTSTSVWAGWNQQLHETFGKTGTAERTGEETQSWYMCYIASENRPIVIAATVEQGGYGAEAAAPIARAMAGEWFNQPQGAGGTGKG